MAGHTESSFLRPQSRRRLYLGRIRLLNIIVHGMVEATCKLRGVLLVVGVFLATFLKQGAAVGSDGLFDVVAGVQRLMDRAKVKAQLDIAVLTVEVAIAPCLLNLKKNPVKASELD